jgi:putative ABC transport system substrate-binding protein
MKRRELITLIGSLAIAWPLACYAQQPKGPLKRVGILFRDAPCPLPPDNPIVRRLAELGWIEGQTVAFECLSVFGRVDQVPELARELVSRRPDVLMAESLLLISALKQETATIPIVMLGVSEPLRSGMITNLARPGGNITGVAWFVLLPKEMELLKEVVPNLRRVAYISGVARVAYPPEVIKMGEEDRQSAAKALGFTWHYFRAASASDYGEIFARLAAEHFDAAYIPTDPFNTNNSTRICQLALRHRIPAVTEPADWAEEGLLLTYGQDYSWSIARGLEYVDKILRGAKPGDLPVEQSPKLLLTINLKTAKELGINVPPSLIARADEVIE